MNKKKTHFEQQTDLALKSMTAGVYKGKVDSYFNAAISQKVVVALKKVLKQEFYNIFAGLQHSQCRYLSSQGASSVLASTLKTSRGQTKAALASGL